MTIPYLPPLSDMSKEELPKRCKNLEDVYTLVLDLDETLIHFEIDEDVDPDDEEPGYYLIRPGALRFLAELSEYFEVVVFTAAMPDVSSLYSKFYLCFYSMLIGYWTISTGQAKLRIAYTGNIPLHTKITRSKTSAFLAATWQRQ